MEPRVHDNGPLVSEFSDDRDMAELVELYVEEMGERVASLERLWNENEIESLRSMAHQLKGASGGYGFPAITDAAAELEQRINEGADDRGELRDAFENLLSLCKRASA